MATAKTRKPRARKPRQTDNQPVTTDTVDTNVDGSTNEEENTNMANDTNTLHEIEFLDDGPPKISRKQSSGVWVDRLAPLRERPGQWARIYGPTKSPHAQVSNLRNNAAGIDADEWEFSGRLFDTDEVDEDGKPVKEGYVYAVFLTDEMKAERDAKRAEREAKKAAATEEA